MPEQVGCDGFESQLGLAVSRGTVDPQSALGQKFTRSLGQDEKQASKPDGAFCWIGYSVIDCFGTAHVSRNQSIAICLTFMSFGSRTNNLLLHTARLTVGAKAGQRKRLPGVNGPRVSSRKSADDQTAQQVVSGSRGVAWHISFYKKR